MPKKAVYLVYRALTLLGKDCDNIGQKSINAYLAEPKAGTHSNAPY
jgi:hypothetical protein